MCAAKAKEAASVKRSEKVVVGVFATGDPRIAKEARERCRNIIKSVAGRVAAGVPEVDVVFSTTLVDGEPEADQVAAELLAANAQILVCVPDTWAFPQLSAISLLQHFPSTTPFNMTCGNSGPKPGVVFAQALNGALAQYGRLAHLNVGTWPDEGMDPQMTPSTEASLLDWVRAANATVSLRGRRILVIGHDAMGMETALAHIIPTRNAYGLEYTRMDMKMLADMLNKKSYDAKELKALRAWYEKSVKSIALKTKLDSEKLDQSLAMYLIVRDLMKHLNAVGGGFMSQLEWGSDKRGVPMPVADAMESLFNSTFDHNGPKAATPFATESDMQGLLTMLFLSKLSGGNPPLFMDFRKVWEPVEIQALAKKIGVKFTGKETWAAKGFVDGNNSGSASYNWAGLPGASAKELMASVVMPHVDEDYFPGLGNSMSFITPGGIKGIAARMAYSSLSGMFTMVWDEAETISLPEKLSDTVSHTTNWDWPHTFITPKYASMYEYKHLAPANHFHMIWGLNTARLQFWMDMTNTLSMNKWATRPSFIEGVDRPEPLLYTINGGEQLAKQLLKARF